MDGEDVPGKRSIDPGDLLPLTPVALNVLLALADGERHGYGIMLEVRERTGGEVLLGPGTLDGAIKRLKEGGMIAESGTRPDPEVDDERRCYYRLTGFGGKVLSAEIERLDGLVRAARQKGAFPAPTAESGGGVMTSPGEPRPRGRERAVGTSERVYRSLLRAYPRDLRDEYGDEMVRCFRDLCPETSSKYAVGPVVGRIWPPPRTGARRGRAARAPGRRTTGRR